MLEAGDTAAAARTFEDPAWRSAAAYRAELYADSLAASDGLEDIESAYNRGNALARLERYDEALAEYDDVLERDPEHNDARYNRDLIRQQQQQQDQRGEGEEQQQQDQQGQGEQQQQQQDQQGQGDEQQQQAGNESAQAEQARQDAAQSGQDSQDPSGEGQAQEDVGQSDDTAVTEDAPRSEGEKEGEREDPREDNSEGEPGDARLAAETGMPDEEAQKMEQWLRKIPDDPAGLLRRKFYYQYQQRDSGRQEDEQW
jgi:Ca-activated chloride channel family protein